MPPNIKPLSQIPFSPSPPAFTDTLIGVGYQTPGNPVDQQYTLAQVGSFNRLTAPLTLYVRTVPVTVSLSNSNPCVAGWPSHGLQVGDPVVFSSPYDYGTCTITIASPGVVTFNNHGYALNDPVSFDSSGALPGGLAINTTYYVIAPTANTFQVAATPSGAPINTSGTQSGTQYVWRDNTIPSGVIDGAVYFVLNVTGPNSFTFSKTVGGTAIGTTTNQVGKVIAQTGNDNNNGLSQTRSGAFLTVGKAWTQICGFYNLNAQIVTVQLAHGSYLGGAFAFNSSGETDNSPVFCSNTLTAAVAAFWLGAGEVLFLGDAANPDAVRFLYKNRGIDTNCDFDGNLTFKGLRIDYVGTFAYGGTDYFQTLGFNTVILDTIVFGTPPARAGAAGTGVRMQIREGTCQLVNPCRVMGSTGVPGNDFILVENSGTWFKNDGPGGIITGVNNPTPYAIFQASDNGFIKSQLTQWAGIWTYNTMGFCDGQGFIYNHQTAAGPAGNPTASSPAASGQVNDRAFFFQFTSPTAQTAAMYGAPGVALDLFYLYIQPASGFTQVLNNSHGHVIIDPAAPLAVGTVQMSPDAWYGQIVNIRTTKAITAMTFSPNAGQFVVGAPTTLAAGQKVEAIFRGETNTWYFSN